MISILILAVVFPFIITPVLNTALVKNKISSLIYQETGTELNPSTFSIALFPRASFNINNYNFNPEDRINIQIESLRFNIDLKELLHGKINIGRLVIDHPVIKPRWLKEKGPELPGDLSISNTIQGLKKVFSFLPGDQNSFELRFKNARSPWFKDMDGTLYLLKEKNEIILDTTMKGLKFRPSTLSFISLEKYLDIDSIEADQLKGIMKLTSTNEIQGRCNFTALKIMSGKKQQLLNSDIFDSFFTLSDDFYQVDINPFNLNYPDGTAEIHFTSDKEKTDLSFIATDIQIDQAKKTSSALFKNNRVARTLFKILPKGIATGIAVSFHSNGIRNLFHPDHLVLKGKLEKGSVNIPRTDLTVSHVTGDARLQNGILDITADKGILLSSKIEKGTLRIDLLNHEDFPFQGDFSLDVDLSMVPGTLISLLPGTPLAKELSLVHGVKGRSKTQLQLSLEPGPGKDLNVKVQTTDFRVSGQYDRIPGDILIENINLTYEGDSMSLMRLNSFFNGNTISDLDMTINFKDEPHISILEGSGMIDIDSTIPWLTSYKKIREMIQPVKNASGKLHITSMDLSGPVLKPDQWKYDLAGTGKTIAVEFERAPGINITAHPSQKQIENMSCQYQISNDFINLENIDMKINTLAGIEPFNNKSLVDDILVPLDMENGHFQIRENNSFFKGSLKFTDGPELHIDLIGDTPASLTMNSIRFLDQGFSDASLILNQKTEKPTFDFTGMLNTDTLNKLFIKESSWTKRIDTYTQGQPVIIHMDKKSTLNVITKNYNLNPNPSESLIDPLVDSFLQDNPVNFKSDALKIKDLILTDVDSKLTLKKDDTYIKLNKAFLCDLQASGYLNLKNGAVFADISFETSDKENIQDLLTCLFQKNEYMDGQYSLTGSILSDGPQKGGLNRLSGSLILAAKGGRIYKLTLLSRILSVLNVSNLLKGAVPDVTQEGFAYKNIFIEADIKDSVIHLTNAVIDGQDMTIIFKGFIDPLNDNLDLVCLVAPFKTVDLIVEKIPVINTLLDGRLLSIPIKASGKLFDPTVTPLHPSAVGAGLVNMMTDILKTPVKLWDKLYGK